MISEEVVHKGQHINRFRPIEEARWNRDVQKIIFKTQL